MSSAALSYPATNQAQADRRPISPKHGAITMTSGSSYTAPICNKFIINIGTSTTVSFTMLDGTTAALGPVPVGIYQFDLMATAVTLGTAADGVINGFYDITGG